MSELNSALTTEAAMIATTAIFCSSWLSWRGYLLFLIGRKNAAKQES
jgi:hypothetical protein